MDNYDLNEKKDQSNEDMCRKLAPLGVFMSSKFEKYRRDIRDIRRKQVSNIKQYDQKNDYIRESVKGQSETMDAYKSKAFNPYSTLKGDEYKAKGLELFLPNGEDNFDLFASEEPQILVSDAERIIETITAEYAKQQLVPNGDIIRKAIKEFADENAKKVKKVTLDLLKECGYKTWISDATFSNGIFGVGFITGPFYKEKERMVLSDNGYGIFKYGKKKVKVPYFDYVPVFNFFPDLDAKYKSEMEGAFISSVLSTSELQDLGNDSRYFKESIAQVIKDNPEGCYQKEEWERGIDANNNQSTPVTLKNKFRTYEYWGVVPAKYLKCILPEGSDIDVESNKDIEDIVTGKQIGRAHV